MTAPFTPGTKVREALIKSSDTTLTEFDGYIPSEAYKAPAEAVAEDLIEKNWVTGWPEEDQ